MDPRRLYLLNGFMLGALAGIFYLGSVVWWVVDLDLSPLRLTVLGTVMEVAVLLSESPTGVVADVYSRKWSIVVSWVVMGVAQILTPLTAALPVLLLWQALWGFGYTFQSGADTAWVTDELGSEDDRLVVNKAVAMGLGVVVGVAGGIALGQWSIRGAIAVSGVIALVYAVALAVLMPENNFHRADRSEEAGGAMTAMVSTWRDGFGLIRGNRILRVLILATLVMSMVDEIVDRLDFPRMRELGFPDLDSADSVALFGGIWIAMTLISLPVMVIVGRRVDQSSDWLSAVLLTGFLAAGAFGVALMAGPIFALAIVGWVIRDVMREVVDPVGEAWANRHATSAVRATVISFRSQSMAFGEIVGGLALGMVAEFVSLAAAFGLGAALLLVPSLQIGSLIPTASRTPAAGPPG